MTIYYGSNETEGMRGTTIVGVNTNANEYDARFARAAMNDNAAAHGPAYGGLSEAWFRFRSGSQNVNWGTNRTLAEIKNSAGTGVLRLQSGATTTDTFRLQYWDGAAYQDIGSTFFFRMGDGMFYDIHAKIDGSTGIFRFYGNGYLYAEQTGDTDHYSGSNLDSFHLTTPSQFNGRQFSEVIVSNSDTRNMRVHTHAPSADGTYSAWTNGFANIDEAATSDADMISSTNIGDIESFVLGDLGAFAQLNSTIEAVMVAFRGRNSATGPQNIDAFIRTNSNDYQLTPSQAVTTSFQGGFTAVWNNNPNTAVKFTVSEINALEAGVAATT